MNDSQDIIENLHMVSPGDPWWWAKALAGILLAAGAVALILWRLYRKGRLPFLQRSVTPPGQTALERLAAIRHLIGEGLVKEFVREASDILRTYIEMRFGLNAPRLSTEEFLYEAEGSPELGAAHRERLADFLFQCDRVKFALGNLDAARMEALYDSAVDFVSHTAPEPEAPIGAAKS